MAKILKLWHQWSWAFHLGWAMIVATALVVTYENAIAKNIDDVADIQRQHKEENMAVRMAVQEQTAKDIRDDVKDIKTVEGKIFERLNIIADRQNEQPRHR